MCSKHFHSYCVLHTKLSQQCVYWDKMVCSKHLFLQCSYGKYCYIGLHNYNVRMAICSLITSIATIMYRIYLDAASPLPVPSQALDSYTVEPTTKGHFGISHFVLCREVVLFSEIKNVLANAMGKGPKEASFVGRLSLRVLYQCSYWSTDNRLKRHY